MKARKPCSEGAEVERPGCAKQVSVADLRAIAGAGSLQCFQTPWIEFVFVAAMGERIRVEGLLMC